jgi:hypothetical protein
LKKTLQQKTNEALGKRKKRRHKRGLTLWNEENKNWIENKKKVYLIMISIYLSTAIG